MLGRIIEVKIKGYNSKGEGVAKYKGLVLFIPFTIRGERVKVKVIKVEKRYAYASIEEVVLPSPERRIPSCNKFMQCGGCDLLHMSYQEQLYLKRHILINALQKNKLNINEIGVGEVIPSIKELAYRNKVELTFSNSNEQVSLGFLQKHSHNVVAVKECCLYGDWVRILIEIVLEFMNKYKISVYDKELEVGLLKRVVARNIDNTICVVFVLNGETIPNVQELLICLQRAFSKICIYTSINRKEKRTKINKSLVHIGGSNDWVEVLGIKAKIDPKSFMQVNSYIRDKIYMSVAERIRKGEIVFDAYGGTGILSAIMSRKAAKVYNIDIIPQAIKDANCLVEKNNIINIINVCGDVNKHLPKLLKSIDLLGEVSIIVDPPRKGLSPSLINILKNIKIASVQLIYISCNPATLARDLQLLINGNYLLKSIQPYDMFPQTCHLETVTYLTKE